VIFGLVLTGCFAALSLGLHQLRLSGFDAAFTALALRLHTPGLTRFMIVVTNLGSAAVIVSFCLVAAVWIWRVRTRAESISGRSEARYGILTILAALVGSFLLNSLLKFVFHRVRPDLFPLTPALGYSYPSGHAMSSIAFYAAVAYVVSVTLASLAQPAGPRVCFRPLTLGILAGLVTLMVGASRVYLGVHYASDVVGGYLAGGAWALLCLAWFERSEAGRGERDRGRVAAGLRQDRGGASAGPRQGEERSAANGR
jgi:undecaprenyl-diphosphatase